MIPITKPFMPPREEYEQYLQGIWEREYLTNNGPLVQELEARLINYLDIKNMFLVSNGTMALQIAIKVLELKGEIITTPFSYVATTSSIVWEGCTPVFADINPETLNIDPDSIEKVISERTSGIIATHVFGNPCNVEKIRKIANKYDLKVIYDAAHGFGTRYKGGSIFNFGDISTVSFHATKLYHTVEGGGIIANDSRVREKISRARNFGHAGPGNFQGVGINGKNSEFHTAVGLCNLKYINSVLQRRKKQCEIYDRLLEGHQIRIPYVQEGTTLHNRAYYPIIFETEQQALEAKLNLEKAGVFPRRYFYPSLNNLDYVDDAQVPHSEGISKRILCLPLYHDLKEHEQWLIADVMNETERMTA